MLSESVQRLPHQGEGVAMDVAAAAAFDWTTVLPSSYATAVDPNVTDNVDKVLTEEDDALSTMSTIDYHYWEEEYPRENSDTDDNDTGDEKEDTDNEDEEEDMDDEDMDEEEEEEDIEVDERDICALPPGTWKEPKEGAKYIPKYTTISSDSDSDSCSQSPAEPATTVRAAELPEQHLWVASWKYKDDPEHWTWINVYAYYNEEKRYGGYGVILRDKDAKPIIASAKFSADGKSFFYQVLMGINAGVALADSYAPSVVDRYVVRCNSHKVPCLVDRTHCCSKCRLGNEICKECEHYLTVSEGCNMSLWPLVQELKHRKLTLEGFPRDFNEAAHYLAKKARDVGIRMKEKADYDEEIKPDAFPSVLQDILWKDAFIVPRYPW